MLDLILKSFASGDELGDCCIRTYCLVEFIPPFDFEFSEEAYWEFISSTVMLSNLVAPA